MRTTRTLIFAAVICAVSACGTTASSPVSPDKGRAASDNGGYIGTGNRDGGTGMIGSGTDINGGLLGTGNIDGGAPSSNTALADSTTNRNGGYLGTGNDVNGGLMGTGNIVDPNHDSAPVTNAALIDTTTNRNGGYLGTGN
ncbi:MAG TPA: hypothetical protein VFE05_21950 [Longimicrobiaceae bacterium]|jgi:hypothetical protein|nr:hypothetical protein [Longimicrobiaceae bacterium]